MTTSTNLKMEHLEKDVDSANSSVNSLREESSENRTGSSGYSNQDESSEKMMLAKKETAAVFRLRVLVFFVLFLAAVAVCAIVYMITSRAQHANYVSQFQAASDLMLGHFIDIAEHKMAAIASLGVTLTARGDDHDSIHWPFVTVTHFQSRASPALAESGAIYVHVNPIVTDEDREQWETQFVLGPDAAWIENSLEHENYVDTFSFLPANKSTRVDDHLKLQPLHGNNIWKMWYHDKNFQTHISEGPGPYLPTWQTSPLIYNGSDINENILQSFRTSAPNVTMKEGTVVFSEFLISPAGGMEHENAHTALYATLMSTKAGKAVEYDGDALSEVFFPIFNSFAEDRHVVGVMVAWIHWRDFFFNLLPETHKGVYLVLDDSCGTKYTYEVFGGDVRDVGIGDRHEPAYNDMAQTRNFDNVTNLNDGTKLGLPVEKDFCDMTLTVYPSNQFKDIFVTSLPIIMTVAVGLVFVFTCFMFLCYDRLIERRQAIVMKRAMETDAVVAQLFPANVRERLIEQANQKKEVNNNKGSMFVNQNNNNRLKGYLEGGNETDTTAAPIAELYPHCTVMFSDISGFTAWSSTREPAQVFILLQTVYQAFDAIAKRRKVFKVETIGDSYVAVTGLPEPMENHAANMARFAWDCLNKMNAVTKDLEVALGPDTGELSMRFGLHSGPVTAGVLQGERARFQLFGDTVNTAARMESTGLRGKIQVSKTTADLIEASGKGQWLKKRKDLVTAKGKGSLQTWWVNPTSKRGSSTASGGSTEGSTNDTSSSPGASEPKPQAASKSVNKRLVSWMVELLMDDIKKVVHTRRQCGIKDKHVDLTYHRPENSNLLDEVQTEIKMPDFNATAAENVGDHKGEEVNPEVTKELHQYVTEIASMYHINPFHNFEHACHVTMSVKKLLKRIVAPDISHDPLKENLGNAKVEMANRLHDYTHGINSDPLTSLAVTFSALIHDVDHRGVSNMQLMKEAEDMAAKYNNKSIAEQNSLDLAWDVLQRDDFKNLRACIFSSHGEMMRFRQLIVNVVLATDIFDKELNDLRKSRWDRAFSGDDQSGDSDLRATIVIEHIIQASDVSHTMQHWHVYQKWNKCLYRELYQAYKQGRMGKNPAEFWYQGEMGFFDNYVIPLAKKLKECGVFGVSSDEYLQYALQNRLEWEERGEAIVADLIQAIQQEEEKMQEKAK